MKINPDFVIREVADTWVVLPLGKQSIKLNGMMTLNPTAAYIWKSMEKDTTPESIAEAMVVEYNIAYDDALRDITIFIDKLLSYGCIEF